MQLLSDVFFCKYYSPQSCLALSPHTHTHKTHTHTHSVRQLLWGHIILSMSNFNDACHLIRFGFNKWGTSSQAGCSSLTPCLHSTARHQNNYSFVTHTVFMLRNSPIPTFIISRCRSELQDWAASGGQIVNSSLVAKRQHVQNSKQ